METLDQKTGMEIVECALRTRLSAQACDGINEALSKMVKDAALVMMLSNKTREDAILALDSLIEAVTQDLRTNTQGTINDNFDHINEKVAKLTREAGGPAIEAFNAVQRAKHTDEAR